MVVPAFFEDWESINAEIGESAAQIPQSNSRHLLSDHLDGTPDLAMYIVHFGFYILVGLLTYGFTHIYHEKKQKQNPYIAPVQKCMHQTALLNWLCKAKEPSADEQAAAQTAQQTAAPTFKEQMWVFFGCFLGLQISYVTWGYFQERIITVKYGPSDTEDRFRYAEALVLINRLSAVCAALVAIRYTTVTSYAPPYTYMMSSLSNVISSYCQYEALRFVTFPLQVVSKSAKIIVAMIMGKIVNRKTYPWRDYLLAFMITVGLVIFRMFDESAQSKGKTDEEKSKETYKFIFGVSLLCFYLTCDAFTSQWQSHVFQAHKINSYQMMLGVNLSSVTIVSTSSIFNGSIFLAFNFLLTHPECLMHASMMSICSATGQMFIFYTIRRFGAVAFASIMTSRQFFSLLVSFISFGHKLSGGSACGLVIVFATMIIQLVIKKNAAQNKADASKNSKPIPMSPYNVSKDSEEEMDDMEGLLENEDTARLNLDSGDVGEMPVQHEGEEADGDSGEEGAADSMKMAISPVTRKTSGGSSIA